MKIVLLITALLFVSLPVHAEMCNGYPCEYKITIRDTNNVCVIEFRRTPPYLSINSQTDFVCHGVSIAPILEENPK